MTKSVLVLHWVFLVGRFVSSMFQGSVLFLIKGLSQLFKLIFSPSIIIILKIIILIVFFLLIIVLLRFGFLT